jgi:hypothetical protein
MVNEYWLINKITVFHKTKRSDEFSLPHKQYEEDNFFEDLMAVEKLSCDYRVGMRAYHPLHPDRIYSVTKVVVLPSISVIATLELLDYPNEFPPIELPSNQENDWIFLPTEEQVALLKRYREKEIVEGIWRTQLSEELISKLTPLIDRLADTEFLDFVPETGNIVRNLVDPSLYAIRRDDSALNFSAWWNWLVRQATD